MAHFPKPFFKQARQLWYVEIDRKQHCLGPDKEAAFLQYHQLMQTQQRTPLGLAAAGVKTPLVAVLADAYLEWVKANRSAGTYGWYRQQLQRFCAKHPTLNVADLKPFHVQQWVDESPHLSKSTRRNRIRSVKACIRWALNQGYIEKNPLLGLPLPPSEYREVTIPLADYQRMLAAINDAGFRDLVVLTWETGCRPQESVRIEARHVDLARQRIVFPKAEAKGKRQPRIIYLTNVALEIVSRCCEKSPTGPIMRQTNGMAWMANTVSRKFGQLQCRMGKAEYERQNIPIPKELVDQLKARLHTHRKSGGQLAARTPQFLRDHSQNIARQKHAARFAPRYSLYSLRHAWATRALESGLDGLTVAILMGHSDPSTLARVYQHLSHNPEHMLAQARKATPPI